MNGEFFLDLDEIVRHIQKAEILSLYFPLLGQALLVDTRCDAQEGPLVRVVPMAGSLEERVNSLKKLRPRFPRPQSLVAIPWTKHVETLGTLGVWGVLVKRVISQGYPQTEEDFRQAYYQLHRAETEELARALRGQGYQSLWEAPR